MTRFVAFLVTVLLGWLFTQPHASEIPSTPVQRNTAAPATRTTSQPKSSRKAAASADDLTEITGIGPVAAQALHELGISSFKQLAAQKTADLAERLPSTMSSRVERENWIEQAKQLSRR